MKILLTGEPRSGKTTVLNNLLVLFPNRQGFITREIIVGGERTGFELVSSSGRVANLASVDSDSKLRVGKYGVELKNLDDFLSQLDPIKPDSLVYVDEIGQMELFSDLFKDIVDKYLNTDNLFIGAISIVYRDDFIKKVLDRDDVTLFHVTQQNRDDICDMVKKLISH